MLATIWRYLQTLLELGGEKSTIVFPLPMDLIKPFLGAGRQPDDAATMIDVHLPDTRAADLLL